VPVIAIVLDAIDPLETVTELGGGVVDAEFEVLPCDPPLAFVTAFAALASADADIAFSRLFTLID
jgi:hypothetical protein